MRELKLAADVIAHFLKFCAKITLFLHISKENVQKMSVISKIVKNRRCIFAFYSYRMDLAGCMCEMKWLGAISTKMLMSSVPAFRARMMGMFSSTGALLT